MLKMSYKNVIRLFEFSNTIVLLSQIRTQERDLYNSQVSKLEKDILEFHASVQSPNNNSDDVVRARSMIFEKMKTCKNQELQIEALNQQVSALREIITITKDMLEIRNLEVRELEQKLDCMELKYKTEKEHHGLINQKLDRMVKINEDLRKEYESQLKLFKSLRDGYEKRSQLDCTENEKSKSCIEKDTSAAPETTIVPDAPASDSEKITTDS